jgi:hypothetical protein
MPTRKVGSGALAGAIVTIIIGVLKANGIQVEPEVASASVVVMTFITQYFISDNPGA